MRTRRKNRWRRCAGVFAGAAVLWVAQDLLGAELPLWLTPRFWLAGGMLVAGANFFFADASAAPAAKKTFLERGMGIALGCAALSVFVSGPPEAVMPWRPYSGAALAESRRLAKPVIVDFYATWCEPCLRLDRAVFGRADVAEAARRFTLLRADVSDQETPATVAAMKIHGVTLIPTVIFIGSNGLERDDLRWMGTGSAVEFKRRLAAVQ